MIEKSENSCTKYVEEGVMMNNFIFENTTKVFLGKGCVKEYLACADSCACVPGVYKTMTHEEILEILKECY